MGRGVGTDRQTRSNGSIITGVLIAVVAGTIVLSIERNWDRWAESRSDGVTEYESSETSISEFEQGGPDSPPVSIAETTESTDEADDGGNIQVSQLRVRGDQPHLDQVVRVLPQSSSASSTLPDTNEIAYDVANLADGNRDTAWIADQAIGFGELQRQCIESPDGSYLELGTSSHPKEWLQWDFYREVTLTHLEVVNGYGKRDDLFDGNSRVRTVRILTNDDLIDEVALADSADVQELELGDGQGLRTERLRLEITSVYCGTAVFLLEGEAEEGASHPALTSAVPYGPLSGAVSREVADRGIVVADLVPPGEDVSGEYFSGLFPHPTRQWVALRDEVTEPVSAEWRVAWKDSRLFIEAIVTDGELEQPYRDQPSQLWKGDSTNFEIGPDARCLSQEAGLRPLDRHYLIAPTRVNGYLRNAVNLPDGDGTSFEAGQAIDIPGFSVETDDGYTIRAEVGLLPGLLSNSSGHVLAANFNVSDVYDGGEGEGNDWVEERWFIGGMSSTNPARIDAAIGGAKNTRPYLWGTLVLRPGAWTYDLLYMLHTPCPA